MRNLSLQNIVAAVRGDYHGDIKALSKKISAVTTDSRRITNGCLFAAIKGENADGHDYIGSAFKKGALCAFAESSPGSVAGNVIIVKDTVKALGDLAMFYRAQFDIPIIGISGSVGKTSAKEMLFSVLSQRFVVHKTEGNLNNELGVPLTLFGIDEKTEVAVIEMGISHFGEMARLAEIVRPNIAMYTVIGSAHLEYLGDLEGVLKAKGEMLPYLQYDGIVFINGDDKYLNKIRCKLKITKYGLNNNCDLRAENIRPLGTEGMELIIKSDTRSIYAKINSFGSHLVSVALAAAAVGIELGLSDVEISKGIAAYTPVGSRAGIIKAGKITIIDDCYNANPTSTAAALSSLAMLSGRRVAILGDMMELGENTESLHHDIGVIAAEKGIELVLACGDLSVNTTKAAADRGTKAIHFKSKEALITALPELIKEGDFVLVKASNSKKFGDIVSALKKQLI